MNSEKEDNTVGIINMKNILEYNLKQDESIDPEDPNPIITVYTNNIDTLNKLKIIKKALRGRKYSKMEIEESKRIINEFDEEIKRVMSKI